MVLPRGLLGLAFLAGWGTAAQADTFDDVAREAQALARSAYRAPAPADERLATWSYDDYRKLRYRPEQSLWRGDNSPFELQFFPLGRGFAQPLRLFEVSESGTRPVVVPADAYTAGEGTTARAVPGAAGWRAHFPLHGTAYKDELIAFLGASYFRALGAGQRYGVSARGLAVDSTGAAREEFPAFTSFWFERPAPGARQMVVCALLDGPRVAGAYRFVVRPGPSTVVEVQARLYLRGPVATLGIAPLTSMFLGGENQPPPSDYRPEVHDSDGLQIATAEGEWLWRPLVNPRGVFTTSFALRSPRGFGLMQRDRRFASYEDLEAHYERRPGVWVEPVGDWGSGRVELLQFHTPDETHDNVVSYWVPDRLPAPGQPLELAWRLHWTGDETIGPPAARVVQTRRGFGYREARIAPGLEQFHLDFAGPGLEAGGAVEAVVTGDTNLRKLRSHAYPNTAAGGWRVTLEFERVDPARPVELRAFLRQDGRVLSETWSYALAPE
ncbi:MAG: glucan biosynthesis protein G [Vitreoscilla sp.]|nr:glucan biosynthesis protein G [Vitreoscilla sp.]